MTAAQAFIQKLVESIFNPFIVFLIALAVVWFLWGVAEYIIYSESEEKRSNGRKHMVWGIIGISIMVSVFAILRILLNSFGVPIPAGI